MVIIHAHLLDIFSQFDNVLILAEGGRQVYFGPTSEVRSYLQEQSTNSLEDKKRYEDVVVIVKKCDILLMFFGKTSKPSQRDFFEIFHFFGIIFIRISLNILMYFGKTFKSSLRFSLNILMYFGKTSKPSLRISLNIFIYFGATFIKCL